MEIATMKILMTNYMETTYPGGISKVIKETCEGLSKNGHDVMVLQPNPYNLPPEESYEGFNIIRVKPVLKEVYGFNVNAYLYIKRILKNFPADVIHIHGYQTLFSLLVSKAIKSYDKDIPLIFSPHTDIYRTTLAGKYFWPIYNYFGKSNFSDSDYIISPSHFEAQFIAKNYQIDEDNISIIPHGVNLIDPKKIVQKNGKCNLLYSGHLVERKGVHHILNSLNSLVNELNFQKARLTIVGDGPEKSKLIKQCKDLKLDDYVIWKSFLTYEELINEIKNSDMFLLLSNSEAYGIIVAEVLALGTPCIVTKATALEEFLNEPGCFGVDYPPDPESVANLIIELYQNKIDVGPFSEKIRTWDKVALDYENLYLNIIKSYSK